MERKRTNHLRLMGAEQHSLFVETEQETLGFTFGAFDALDFLKPARFPDIVTWPVAVKGASITVTAPAARLAGRGEGGVHERGTGAAVSVVLPVLKKIL